MPLTYIDIEKQKTWRIGIFFLVLLFMYFCVTFTLLQGFLLLVFPFQVIGTGSLLLFGNPLYLLTIFLFSAGMAAVHFWFSAYNAVQTVLRNLGAIPPDPDDGVHRRLLNIMAELHVVTGTAKKIQCTVIPSLSMNALAVSDLKGNSAIAITEGLLSRLTRDQTEAVLAHEAYHILSGDCMEATVATSLFGLYAAMIEKMQSMGEDERSGLHPAFFLFWLTLKLSQLLSLFISREREYRADAAAVGMTRNPRPLAEALDIISRNWNGSGLIAEGLEMLCITGPQEDEQADESEGFWANLMSTHPPIGKRIDVLLRMVRTTREELRKGAGSESGVSARTNRFPLLQGELSSLECPLCRLPLCKIPYEKTSVFLCHSCGGILTDNNKIPRIIARREQECTERVASLAMAVIRDNQRTLSLKILKGARRSARTLRSCPKCHNPMLRTFYSLAYLIEIDRCGLCNLTWFDVDELEMLQCLIENKMTASLDFTDRERP